MTIEGRMGWVLMAAALAVSACGGDAQAEGQDTGGATASAENPAGASAPTQSRVINVEVAEVVPVSYKQTIPLTGVARAMRDVTISAEESGVVREIVRDKGRSVSTGQTIVRLDDTVLAAQVRTAQAQASLAEELWERRKKLFEEDRVGSEVSYLEARSQAEQAAGNLQALEERLSRTRIAAPISGILDMRMVEVGTMVSPGTPVARVVQVNPVKILAGVPERFALAVRRGAAATVRFDVLPGETFEGTLSYVSATVDPGSRTFAIELTLPNPDARIKPEMVATISLTRSVLDSAIVLSQDALVRDEGGFIVFVVNEGPNGTVASARSVKIASSQGNDVVIGEGLEPGERYVVVGQQQVADGDRVQVVRGVGTEE